MMLVRTEVAHVRFEGENFKRVADASGVRWFRHPENDMQRWVPVNDDSRPLSDCFEDALERAFIEVSS